MLSICEKPLGLFAKQFRKAAASSIIILVHLSALMEQHDSHLRDFREIFYSRLFQKIVNASIFYCKKTKLVLYMRNYI